MKPKKVVEPASPVYFGLGYTESLEAKKNLLASEMSFLNMIKFVRRYGLLRKEELEIKVKIYKSVRELEVLLKRTKASFPFIKIPERAKRETLKKEKGVIRKDIDADLENELRKIQERLKSISERD